MQKLSVNSTLVNLWSQICDLADADSKCERALTVQSKCPLNMSVQSACPFKRGFTVLCWDFRYLVIVSTVHKMSLPVSWVAFHCLVLHLRHHDDLTHLHDDQTPLVDVQSSLFWRSLISLTLQPSASCWFYHQLLMKCQWQSNNNLHCLHRLCDELCDVMMWWSR